MYVFECIRAQRVAPTSAREAGVDVLCVPAFFRTRQHVYHRVAWPPTRLCRCVRVARCIIVSAGSWLGGPVDISGLRCSCLSGSRTQRARRLGLGV